MAKEDRLMAQQTVVQRLANFAGPVGRCSKNYRAADSGRPLGLLLGTPTFMEAQNLDASLKESKETKEPQTFWSAPLHPHSSVGMMF